MKAKTDSELERIVRDKRDDPVVLNAVHLALKGRTRKRAVALRAEIRELLGLDRFTGAPMRDVIIWTTAPGPPKKPWYRKWAYVLTLLGSVGVGALYGVGFRFWQMVHQQVVSLGERFQLF